MTTAPRPLSWGPDAPFRFIGGTPGLDLVNTAAWTRRGLTNDRLTDYGRVVEWAVGAGLVTAGDGVRLRRAAAGRRDSAETAWARARELRSVLQRLFVAVANDAPLNEPLRRFEPWVAEALAQLRLSPAGLPDRRAGRALRWTWAEDQRLDALLWPVIRDAAELLASPEAAQIRICGGDDCGWVYVDRSRNRLRRWCEMETCGTRAKSLRRASRRAAGG